MTQIGLFYGTQTGNTQTIAEMIQAELGGAGVVTLHDICQAEPDDFDHYSTVIIGCPTWNIGELQADWEGFYHELDDINFSSKVVAYFGCGDQIGYADNFQDAMGLLATKITELGGKTIGYWPTDGYAYTDSKAVVGNQLVGLAIDEDNQAELTASRVKTWVAQLKSDLGI
jgi:flavodoxin I